MVTPEPSMFCVFFDHTNAQCSKRDHHGRKARRTFPADAVTYRKRRWHLRNKSHFAAKLIGKSTT
jgi:hypothetical protein